MAASRVNYLVVYPHDSQVYGSTSKEVALSSPPPDGMTLKEKRVFFVSVEPESGNLVWYRVPQEEVESAEIILPKAAIKKKKKKEAEDAQGEDPAF